MMDIFFKVMILMMLITTSFLGSIFIATILVKERKMRLFNKYEYGFLSFIAISLLFLSISVSIKSVDLIFNI